MARGRCLYLYLVRADPKIVSYTGADREPGVLFPGRPLSFMNSDLSHLPEAHRADLARVVEMVRAEVKDAEMVILFGSFARGEWKSETDLPPPDERRSGHPSDYDILVITTNPESGGDTATWNELGRQTRGRGMQGAGFQTHARFIGYDIDSFNERLADGRYFHTDIVKEGIMLYDSGNVKLGEIEEISAERRQALAREYFEEGMATATSFFENFEFRLSKDDTKNAAFQLHQAAEGAYKTILLVFTHYSPHEHFLETLGDEAGKYVPSVAGIFAKETPEDRQRFEDLDYAYIGARYDRNYSIGRADLEILARSVRELLDRARTACETALQTFGSDQE